MSQPQVYNASKASYEELENRLACLEAELAEVKTTLRKEQLAHAQTKDELYLTQQRFEGIFTYAPFPTVFFKADGSLISINPYFQEEWGISTDNLPANYNILTDPQLEAAGIMPIIKKAFQGEYISAPTILYDNTRLVIDKSQLKKKKRWLNSFFFPIKDQQGQLREIGLTHNELTAYKQSEELAYGQIETLLNSLKHLATQTDLETFTSNLLKEITAQLGANNAGFFLVEEGEEGKQVLVMKEFLKDGEFKSVLNDPELTLFQQPWDLESLPNWNNIVERQGKFDLVLPENVSAFWPDTFEWHQQLGNKVILSYALTVGTRPIGYLGLGYQDNYTPDEQKRELGQALVYQLTLAVQLRRLAQETKQAAVLKERELAAQERVAQLTKTNQLLSRNLATLGTQAKLDMFLKKVMCALNSQLEAAVTYLFLYDEASGNLNLNITVEQNQVIDWHTKPDIVEIFGNPIHKGLSSIVDSMIRERKPFIFDHLADYQSGNTSIYWPGSLDWHLGRGHRWAIIAPLLLDQEFLGMLGIAFFRPLEINNEELELAQALTNQLTLALQLTRLAEREQQAAILEEREKAVQERVSWLAHANQLLGHNLAVLRTQTNLDVFLEHILHQLNSQLDAAVTHLFLFDEDTQTLNLSIAVEHNQVVDWQNCPDLVATFGSPIPIYLSSITTQMIRERKPLIFNVLEDYREGNTIIYRPGALEWHLERGHKWGIIVPLLLDEQLLGMLGLAFFRPLEISKEELELAQALANQVTLALQLTRLAEREQQEATQTAVLQERNRMAREIHDTLAQNLTGIVVQLQAADGKSDTDPTREGHLEAARQLAREALTEARRSVWALRPQVLEGTDLPTALAELIKKTAAVFRTTSPALIYQVEGTPYLLPAKLEEQILRVGQEALTNALKYAEATKLEVTLTFRVDGVSLRINDDGVGFEPSQAEHKGFGLLGMRERASALKASLTIESRAGQGCQVTLFVPIKPD